MYHIWRRSYDAIGGALNFWGDVNFLLCVMSLAAPPANWRDANGIITMTPDVCCDPS